MRIAELMEPSNPSLKIIDSAVIKHGDSTVKDKLDSLGGSAVVINNISEATEPGVRYLLPRIVNGKIEYYDEYFQKDAQSLLVHVGTTTNIPSNILTDENLGTRPDNDGSEYSVYKDNDRLKVRIAQSSTSGMSMSVNGNVATLVDGDKQFDAVNPDYINNNVGKDVQDLKNKIDSVSSVFNKNYVKTVRFNNYQSEDGFGLNTYNQEAFAILPTTTQELSDDPCRVAYGGTAHSMTYEEFYFLVKGFKNRFVTNYQGIEGLNGILLSSDDYDLIDVDTEEFEDIFIPVWDANTEMQQTNYMLGQACTYGTCLNDRNNELAVLRGDTQEVIEIRDAQSISDQVRPRYVGTIRRAVAYEPFSGAVSIQGWNRILYIDKYNLGATHGDTKESWYGNRYMFGDVEARTKADFTEAKARQLGLYDKYQEGVCALSANIETRYYVPYGVYNFENISASAIPYFKATPRDVVDSMPALVTTNPTIRDTIVNAGLVSTLDLSELSISGTEMTIFFETTDNFELIPGGSIKSVVGTLSAEANKKYVLSILNGVAIMAEVTDLSE